MLENNGAAAWMRILHRHIASLLGTTVLALVFPAAFSQAGISTTPAAAQPPAIDEKVPPPNDNYTLEPDSQPHPSVPAGRLFTFELTDSKVFPGTTRVISVYVPAAYKGDKPACVYVGLDSLTFQVPAVFDNLIAQHAIPVTIGIGVSSGTVNSTDSPRNPRYDRSFEFDSLNGRLGLFLLEDVLPEVEKHRTPDGYPILLSKDPNDRAIGGASTGGIGAFTVAWQYPDAFRRVFSAIGTYVGMRGGEQYYVLVRKTESKPLRIFMQDGVHDEWPGGPEMGDWWMSNQTMQRALTFAGYDMRHIWGAGTHNGNQAASVFPDAMRWLWRDWPAPIRAGESDNPVLRAILEPGSSWQVAAGGCASTNYLASNQLGQVFSMGGGAKANSQMVSEGDSIACQENGEGVALAFGPRGELYRGRSEGGLGVTAHSTGTEAAKILIPNLHVRAFTVRSNGNIYAATESSNGQNELWLIRSTGEQLRLAEGLKEASGLALSPDGLWLFVAQSRSHYGMSYRVLHDGTVDAGEPFYRFSVPDWEDDSGASGVSMDRDGRAYAATRLGVQVFDRNGRVAAILPLPGNEPATGICFGGRDFDTLYVAAGGKIYCRKLRAVGAPPWAAPFDLPRADAG